jgi:LacI family transcriptional regulator, galactose operon repressor
MHRIGIQVDFAGGYGRGVLRGVMAYANLRADWEFEMPPMYMLSSRKLELRKVDGVIAMIHASRSFDRFRRARVPMVNTARTMSAGQLRRAHMPTVLPDDVAVGKTAFSYFWDRLFRSYGFCGHPTASWSLLRRGSFAAECRREGVFFSDAAAVNDVPADWIKSLPRPCAVLAANDRYAWHAIDVCRQNEISVPEEIAVLGVDNDVLLNEMARPTLSSIDVGAEQIGFEAARILDGLMKGQPAPRQPVEMAPHGVITRHSTDVLSIEDEVIAEAAKFIRQHASEPISVEDVLTEATMSRRNLERRFRRVMRRSLLEEIRRVHLDRASKLLRETSLDIPSVAEQSGYASHVRFSTVFKEQLGVTPTAYRRSHRLGMT